jgi:predicted HTH transcriptional regulator
MDALNLKPTREAETEEYKRSWQEKECLDALVALANTRGGVLWVGVQDNGSIVGWQGDGKEMERISNTIVAKLQVHPRSMTIATLEGTPVLAIQMAQAVSDDSSPTQASGYPSSRFCEQTQLPNSKPLRWCL